MGVLTWLWAGGNRHRKLDETSDAAGQLRLLEAALHRLVAEAPAPVEIVLCDEHAFVFVGRPPAEFQFFRIAGNRVQNLSHWAGRNGPNASTEKTLHAALAQAYQRSGGVARYRTRVAGRPVLVISWHQLALEIATILERGTRAGDERGTAAPATE